MNNFHAGHATVTPGKYAMRIIWCVVLCGVLGLNPVSASDRHVAPDRVMAPLAVDVLSPELQQLLDSSASDTRLPVIISFKAQADLAQVGRTLGPVATGVERRQQLRVGVFRALKSVADVSQTSFNAFLSSPVIAAQVEAVRPFWIFNGAGVRATPQAIQAMAARSDVVSITIDHWRQRVDVPDLSPATQASPPITRVIAFAPQDTPAPVALPWGITQIRADSVWTALGITGTGVTIANIDSGVDWQHPALQSAYRGWRANGVPDHLHNWYDATGEAADYPTDMYGHGTHTMGTMVGQGGIGVAPGARWMAAKGLDRTGSGYDSWLHAAFEFMLAPGGDPSFAPDVISNSWGNNDGTDTTFQGDIATVQSAGIFVVFSNGNAGPRAGSVGSPASLHGAIGIGATDPDDEVTNFSSRGPSPFGEVRPMLSAPGLKVVSSFPGGAYATSSGTSMAAPHVAGAAALLLSANPSLDITSTLYALTSTAVHVTAAPNNNIGWGRVDAYAAALSVMTTGVITGIVLDAGQPISDALVIAGNGATQAQALSGADGSYAIRVAPGAYTATASAFGYNDGQTNAQLVVHGQVKAFNFNLNRKPYGIVSGSVYDAVSGAQITTTVITVPSTPRSSSSNIGIPPMYYISLPTGAYTLEARALGYLVQTRTVTISEGAALAVSFHLTPTQRIVLVDTGAWYYASATAYYRAALDALSLTYDEIRVRHVPADTPDIAQLLKYDTVIWSAPQDSPGVIGAGDVISNLIGSGRNLIISGQDVAFYDGGGYFGEQSYFRKLNAYYYADNAPTRHIIGEPGTFLSGNDFSISGGEGMDNQGLPDVIAVRNADYGNQIARYDAAVYSRDGAVMYSQTCLNYRAAFFSFGIEGINSTVERSSVIGKVLAAFDVPRPTAGLEVLPRDNFATGLPIGLPGQTLSHTVRVRNTGDGGITDTLTFHLYGYQWTTSISPTQITLAPCASALVNVSVTIPLTATRNTLDTAVLTVTSANSPTLSTTISLTSKTPAAILLVDDDRFYNREHDYLDAFSALGNEVDRFDNHWETGVTLSPPLTTLQMYHEVVWFNAYDWYDPLTVAEENRLQQYLDGGGRLFLTSQAVLAYTNLYPFNRNYLGIAAINFNDTTLAIIGAPDSAIGDGFAGGTMLPWPYNWNLSTALLPMSNTQVILRGDSGQPFGLARAGATIGLPWRTTFMPFAFETLTSTVRADLMNRVVGWLSWLGESTFGASTSAVSAGQIVTYTAILRADDMVPPILRDPTELETATPLTTSVSVSFPLASNLAVVSSTLASATDHDAGEWHSMMAQGDVVTLTFTVSSTAGLSDGTALTATMFVGLDGVAMRFARQVVVHSNTPVLVSSLDLAPAPVRWRNTITLTLHVTNTSGVDAPLAHVTDAVPFALSLITPSLSVDGGGVLTTINNRVNWDGAIEAGGAITLTYAVNIPRLNVTTLSTYYNAAIVDNGAGQVAQSALWITPEMRVYYMPVVVRQT